MNAPVTPGTFSMTWKSTAQTASGGNQNRIGGYYSAGSVDPFAFGADVSFDFWTNDDNPRFLVALGSYQNYIFEAGGLTGQVCYVGNNFQRSFLCNYECSTWYHVDIRVHQALTQTGTITYTIRRWTGSAMETIVDHVTVAYLPWANATNDGSYEYSSNCNDALLASGTVIAGNTGISRLDNFSLRSLAPPRIGVFTPQANPDRGVLLQGDLFTSQLGIDAGKDTGVWAYQQSTASNGVLYQPNILRAADQALATALDAGAPYGMCLLWAQNAAGAGYPVRVNGTDAWWIGPNHAGTEATVNVYGRNLSWNNGTTTSYVYIRPWGAGSESTSTVCDVTEVNPYKVSFTIPVLSAGDYEVWIHNGHGGIYGWSGPLKFTVDAGPRYVWNGTTHNVRLAPYNAVGNGVADDLPAIQAAINAASSGDRIYLPAGAYRISNRLYVSWKSLSFEGDGATQTTLYADNAYTATGMLYFHHGAAPARVINMKFDSASQTAMNMIWTDWYGGNPTPEGVIVDSCAFTSIPDVYDVGACIAWCKDVRVTNCTATGPSIAFLYMVHQGFVHGNDYLGNGRVYGPTAYAGFSSLQCDYSDNTAASVNRQTLRQAVKRFFVGSSNWGLLRNLYCGDSSSLECGPLPEDADQNGGENVCIETDQAHYSGSPIAVTATTLTFAGVNWTPNSFNADAPMTLGVMDGSLVYVHKGPGIGQWRRIIGNTANTITVDRPWDVPLDTSSIIAISEAGCQMAIYSNTLDGVYDDDGDEIPDYIERPSMSTCGVSFFTNNQDVVTADNDITHERYGIGLYGFTNPVDPSNNWGAQSNNLVVGNTITDGYDGLMASSIVAPSGAGETSLGPVILNNVFRDNQITNMSCEGIWIDRNYSNYFWDLPWAQHNLFEHNTLVDCATGVTFGSQQAYNLLRNNTFTRNILGSMAGVYFDAYNDSPYLYCNVYGAGVSPIYAGSPLGSGQQYNKRALVFEGIVGGTPPGEQTITLTNVGTSVLSMSAPVSDAAWLSADFSPSTVNPEQGGTLTVSVDPAGLLVGTYTGALTLYGGTLYSPQTVSATLILHSPTATNSNPTVSITAPTNGFSYAAPATINITANATDSDGTISKVEFYNNGILLGTDTSSAGGWTYSWTNVEASGASGISLTAKAYDNYNASTTSSAITGTVTDTALKCYWKLDSTSGTSCTDSSGTGNTGTTYSSPTWVAGKVLNCLNFNGTTQYAADTSTTGLPALGADQTLCCWIYVSSNPTVRKTALNTSYSTTYGNNIGFLSSTTFGVWRQGGTAIVTTTSLPTAGYWHHVAYVKSGSNKYLYIDGAQAATSTATTNTSSCTRIYVGRTASGADYWPGKVDEVRVYNRVLTLAEIQSLAAGKQ
jgi:hypothetical protein